jgi:hypothetical protein
MHNCMELSPSREAASRSGSPYPSVLWNIVPYLEPDESSPYQSISMRSNLIISSHLRLPSPSGPSLYQNLACIPFLPRRATWHTYLINLDLIVLITRIK